MKSEFIARIFTPTTVKDQWEAGTAYPIAQDLLITARHVLYPEQRDETQLRQVEWPDCKDAEGRVFTSDITGVLFDGGQEIDIAVVACKTPPEVNTSIKLSDRDPATNEGWDSFGYPQAGTDNQGKQEKIPGKGTFFQPDASSHILHLTSDGDASTKELWQGMSGAPVFNRNKPRQLMAVIAATPKGFDGRLYAVSIPYLLRENQNFKKCVGFLADAQSAASLMPLVKLGTDFKKFLNQKISTELQRPEARWLYEQLAEHFNYDKTVPDLITLIAESLLNCQVDEAVCNYLARATTDCILATGKRRYEVADKADSVRQVAEQILGWLVLASIDDNAIQKVWRQCNQNNSLFFRLGVDSFAGVEIVLSRGFNRKTDFPNEVSADPTGRYFIPHQKSWAKYDEGEAVRKILIEIWNKVFPLPNDQKKSEDVLKEKELKRLNSAIKIRRADPKSPEHYYIAFEVSEVGSEFDENIYHQLLTSLKDMTVVQFGITESDSLFLIAEEDVTTAIDEFYRAINGLKGQ